MFKTQVIHHVSAWGGGGWRLARAAEKSECQVRNNGDNKQIRGSKGDPSNNAVESGFQKLGLAKLPFKVSCPKIDEVKIRPINELRGGFDPAGAKCREA